mgnify:CR=1 FL=1
MQLLKFEIFGDKIMHAVSTRDGGVSSGPYESLDLRLEGGDSPKNVRKNYEIFSEAVGFNLDALAIAHQEHTDKILVISDPVGLDNAIRGVDGFMTNQKNIPLMVRFADCQGVLFYDPIKQVIAAVHSGWRGNTKNILGKTVAKMKSEFGSNPANILLGISQSLCPKCAEFSDPMMVLPESMHKYINGKHVDLWQCSLDQLEASGVLLDNVELMGRCTVCEYDKFFSVRAGKTVTGHMGAVIQLT